MGTILLLTALGVAIGITTLGDPRASTDYVEPGLGIGASIWGAITLLLACFLGGMVSTRVTDRPDRGGAFIHGTLVWTLVAVFLLWLVGQGISFGLSNLLGALGGLAKTATTAVTSVVSGDGDLAQRLGLDNPSQIMNRLDDPEVVSVFASATGMSTNEAQSALNQLRSQVEAVRDNPDRVATEVRNFLGQYADRAKQQARQVAATVQEGTTVGAWITFGVLAATLIVAVLGALAGIPSLGAWHSRWAHAGAA
jgi:methyl-accepting chemotaxis protein